MIRKGHQRDTVIVLVMTTLVVMLRNVENILQLVLYSVNDTVTDVSSQSVDLVEQRLCIRKQRRRLFMLAVVLTGLASCRIGCCERIRRVGREREC